MMIKIHKGCGLKIGSLSIFYRDPIANSPNFSMYGYIYGLCIEAKWFTVQIGMSSLLYIRISNQAFTLWRFNRLIRYEMYKRVM